jgi:transcription elongation factor Elf1
MSKLETAQFTCPTCNAEYRVVRVTADPALADREITCRSCGAPLQGREGGFVLKYFLVNRPRVHALRRRHA